MHDAVGVEEGERLEQGNYQVARELLTRIRVRVTVRARARVQARSRVRIGGRRAS